jgi:hypothetical protein
MLWSGEQEWCRGSKAASSEAETHPRGCQALERGGDSPEGASSPRVRRRCARGGVCLLLTFLSITTKMAQTATVTEMLVDTCKRHRWVHTSSNGTKGRLG